jgi:hypothetical protein
VDGFAILPSISALLLKCGWSATLAFFNHTEAPSFVVTAKIRDEAGVKHLARLIWYSVSSHAYFKCSVLLLFYANYCTVIKPKSFPSSY